jgi:hypothetical protein
MSWKEYPETNRTVEKLFAQRRFLTLCESGSLILESLPMKHLVNRSRKLQQQAKLLCDRARKNIERSEQIAEHFSRFLKNFDESSPPFQRGKKKSTGTLSKVEQDL